MSKSINIDTTDFGPDDHTSVKVITSHWYEGAVEGFYMTVGEDSVTFSFYTDNALTSSKTFDSWENFYDFITTDEIE